MDVLKKTNIRGEITIHIFAENGEDVSQIKQRIRELLPYASIDQDSNRVSCDFLSETDAQLISKTIEDEFDNVSFEYNRIKK